MTTDSNDVLPAEDSLCQVLAAAHRERVYEHREPDDGTDDGCLRQGGDPANRSDVVKEPQHQPVVDGAQKSGQQSEDDEKGQPREGRGADGFDVEVGVVSQDQPRAAHRCDSREKRRQHGFYPERLRDLFEREKGSSDRCVERDRQAGTAQRRLHHPDLGIGQPSAPRRFGSDRRAHVHRRPFAAQHKPGSHAQHTADELRRKQADERWPGIAPKNRLDMLDAASGGQRLPPHDQGGQGCAGRGGGHGDQPAWSR